MGFRGKRGRLKVQRQVHRIPRQKDCGTEPGTAGAGFLTFCRVCSGRAVFRARDRRRRALAGDGKEGVHSDGSTGGEVSRLEVIAGPDGRRQRTKTVRAALAKRSACSPERGDADVVRAAGSTVQGTGPAAGADGAGAAPAGRRMRLRDLVLQVRTAPARLTPAGGCRRHQPRERPAGGLPRGGRGGAGRPARQANRRLEDMPRTSQPEAFGKRSETLSPAQFGPPPEDADLARGAVEAAAGRRPRPRCNGAWGERPRKPARPRGDLPVQLARGERAIGRERTLRPAAVGRWARIGSGGVTALLVDRR
jgi:hypothetical protein